MKLSHYDLVYGYLKKYCGDEATDELIKTVTKDFKKMLNSGWTAEEVVSLCKQYEGLSYSDLSKVIAKTKSLKKNILKTDNYYWHSQLRITPGAPKRQLDYNTGEIVKVEEEHFMEMRASYTLDDLLNYYQAQHGVIDSYNRSKYIGGLKYVLNNHSIDTVLFMIDASANYIKSEDRPPLSSPLDMQDYLRDARNLMGDKITEERTAGDEGIVPRRRLPLHRSGSKATQRAV